MSLQTLSDSLLAHEPCAMAPECYRADDHQHYVGWKADSHYFAQFPRRRLAIRRALSEFDCYACCGHFPLPPLFVAVSWINADTRVAWPFYRGTPFWPERACREHQYAAPHSDAELFQLIVQSREMGGMNPEARVQFDKHNNYAKQCRHFFLGQQYQS